MPKVKQLPIINYSLCMACRVCISACPVSCLEETKMAVDSYMKAYPQLEQEESCTGCEICAKVCPVEVIEMVG
jgi:formate hydrogenlyase subunit 6/NADH:ubiquinone oxidoreductase subunit I